jgi:3-hydroxyisobutyrate dehydrogenase
MAIGYVGVGSMGGALARRLQLQHRVTVFDLNADFVQRMVEKGSSSATSLAELGAACDVILLCLPTSKNVEQVIFGEGGLAGAVKPGTLIVDQTSGDANATREMAQRAAKLGFELIDAPVSGGPRGADAGTIAIMVGADDAQFARIQPILAAISPNIFHTGGVGTGHVMKSVNNMLSGTLRIATLEAMAVAVKNGMTPQKTYEVLMASSGRNNYLEKVVAQHVLTGKFAHGFTLGLIHKDVKQACMLGESSGVPMFVGNTVREFYQMCIGEYSYNTEVNAAALVMDRLAGTHLVPEGHNMVKAK